MTTSFQFSEYQNVGVQLAQLGGEGCLRSAVSRVYYALFHVALARTGARSRRSIHRAVVDAVKKRNRALGGQLDTLRRLRVEADYRLMPRDRNVGMDWQQNWQRASRIASHILPKLRVM